MVQAYLGPVKHPVRFGQRADVIRGEIVAFECYHINAAGTGWNAVDQHVRGYVV